MLRREDKVRQSRCGVQGWEILFYFGYSEEVFLIFGRGRELAELSHVERAGETKTEMTKVLRQEPGWHFQRKLGKPL